MSDERKSPERNKETAKHVREGRRAKRVFVAPGTEKRIVVTTNEEYREEGWL